MNDVINITLPNKAEYVTIARLTVSTIANNMGFDIEDVEDIKLAVGEACNNTVIHCENADYFDINIFVKEDYISIEIIDNGSGFDEKKYKEPDLENLDESGLGIFIIKSLMDEVTIINNENEGSKLIMKKNTTN